MKNTRIASAAICLYAWAGMAQGAGLTFNIDYTQAVRTDGNFANIQNAVNYVANEYSSLYTDPITLSFTIDEGAVGLGQSQFSNNYWRGSYATLRTALAGDSKTAADATAVANLPGADPYSGGCGTCWYAPSAEAKAIGLVSGAIIDGTYTFDNTVHYTYDPNNRSVVGAYDFIGVTEHEFSELMGRTSQSPEFGYDIMDLYRYTGVGIEQNAQVRGVYFSYDNGVTNLAGYNAGEGDKQDLDGAVATDPFNASTSTEQGHLFNAVDTATLDVIGFDRVSATPEPATFLLALPLIGFGLMRRHRRSA